MGLREVHRRQSAAGRRPHTGRGAQRRYCNRLDALCARHVPRARRTGDRQRRRVQLVRSAAQNRRGGRGRDRSGTRPGACTARRRRDGARRARTRRSADRSGDQGLRATGVQRIAAFRAAWRKCKPRGAKATASISATAQARARWSTTRSTMCSSLPAASRMSTSSACRTRRSNSTAKACPFMTPLTLQAGNHAVFIAGDVDGVLPLLHEAADEGRAAGTHAARFPQVGSLVRRCADCGAVLGSGHRNGRRAVRGPCTGQLRCR